MDGDEVDLCLTDPGRDVDLTVWASLMAMTRIWIGHLEIENALSSGELVLDGSAELARSLPRWIGVPARAREREDRLRRLTVASSRERPG